MPKVGAPCPGKTQAGMLPAGSPAPGRGAGGPHTRWESTGQGAAWGSGRSGDERRGVAGQVGRGVEAHVVLEADAQGRQRPFGAQGDAEAVGVAPVVEDEGARTAR